MAHLMYLLFKQNFKIKMNKEELLIQKRIIELSKAAYFQNRITYTDFLNLNEQNIFYSSLNEIAAITYKTYGGYELAERQMIAFIPDALSYECSYPIQVVKVSPSHKKFSDKLTHRDFLGATLNLGIHREKIGDILVKDNEGYIFCHDHMSNFLIQELKKVKHTNVTVSLYEGESIHIEPDFEEIGGSIASNRIDCVLTMICKVSRTASANLITSGNVFINGRQILSNNLSLKENDIISIRGNGKYIFKEITHTTKKGRIFVRLFRYQ